MRDDAKGAAVGEAESAVDRVKQEGRWAFDDEVARVFDNMLERSIPQYAVMRRAVFQCGMQFARPGSTIVDCGASRGAAIAPFVEALGDQSARFVCIESSEPMSRELEQRFADHPAGDRIEIHNRDLREFYPDEPVDLTLAVLTLQFIPLEHRQDIVRTIWQRTRPGGALIVVEKVLGATSAINRLMVDIYHGHKRENGYSTEEIDRKALSLEGVLVPVTGRWNQELLEQAGFAQIDCIWRWMNFAAWVAIKSSD